jgi:hypothetical protein
MQMNVMRLRVNVGGKNCISMVLEMVVDWRVHAGRSVSKKGVRGFISKMGIWKVRR